MIPPKNAWVIVPSTVDTTTNTISAQISQQYANLNEGAGLGEDLIDDGHRLRLRPVLGGEGTALADGNLQRGKVLRADGSNVAMRSGIAGNGGPALNCELLKERVTGVVNLGGVAPLETAGSEHGELSLEAEAAG